MKLLGNFERSYACTLCVNMELFMMSRKVISAKREIHFTFTNPRKFHSVNIVNNHFEIFFYR
jgi:hypothetical protein